MLTTPDRMHYRAFYTWLTQTSIQMHHGMLIDLFGQEVCQCIFIDSTLAVGKSNSKQVVTLLPAMCPANPT